MPGPWEKYKKPEPAAGSASGPWNKYKASAPKPEAQAPAPEPDQDMLDKLASMGMSVVNGVLVPVGRAIDTYTGAPSRAAISKLQDEDPSVIDAAGAFVQQFGRNPDEAPSGRQIAQKAGYSDKQLSDAFPDLFNETGEGWQLKKDGWADISSSGAAGLAVDVAGDWTNLIPVAAAAKLAGKGGAAAAKAGVKGAAKVADVATGTGTVSKAIDAIGEGADQVGVVLDKFVNPKRADNWDEIVKTAEKHGISPEDLSESIEFGPQSFIARNQRSVAEGPIGEAALARHNAGLKKLEGALESQATRQSPKLPVDKAEAGALIRADADDILENLVREGDITRKSVMKYAPGLQVDREAGAQLGSVLNGVEKHAKGMMLRGDPADIAQAKYLMKAVEQIRNTKGSYKQLVEAMDWIGKKAFPKKGQTYLGQVPHDVERLRDIYFASNDAVIGTVRKHVSPEMADEIIANNARIHGDLEKLRGLDKELSPAVPDEQVFTRLLGNTNSIDAAKKALKPETLAKMKGAFLQNRISRLADGGISFTQLQKDLDSNGHLWRALFEPQELQAIQEITELGANYGPAIMSSSGTGASNKFVDLLKGVRDGMVGENFNKFFKDRARKPQATPLKPDSSTSGQMNLDMMTRMAGRRDHRIAQAGKFAQVSAAGEQDQRVQSEKEARDRFIEGN